MPGPYLLLAGSSEAYLLLAGSSVKLIFIGWLLLRTACELCRAEVELEVEGALPGRLGPAQIALSPVWENMQPCFHLQDKETVTAASPHFLSFLLHHLPVIVLTAHWAAFHERQSGILVLIAQSSQNLKHEKIHRFQQKCQWLIYVF